jgi:hypothetical protein
MFWSREENFYNSQNKINKTETITKYSTESNHQTTTFYYYFHNFHRHLTKTLATIPPTGASKSCVEKSK